jgi:hypothetical protein
MKKKCNAGKNFSGKGIDRGVDVYYEGENDAYNNLGNHSGKYTGHLKKCYRNGYLSGQRKRSCEKM